MEHVRATMDEPQEFRLVERSEKSTSSVRFSAFCVDRLLRTSLESAHRTAGRKPTELAAQWSCMWGGVMKSVCRLSRSNDRSNRESLRRSKDRGLTVSVGQSQVLFDGRSEQGALNMKRAVRRIGLGLIALALLRSSGIAVAACTARWNGTSGNYSDGTKWDVGSVPCGACDVTFPAGSYTVTMDVASCSVSTVSIGDNVTFRLASGKSYTVTTNASVAGIVDDPGGMFSAPNASFAGNRARAYVSGGGRATIHAPSYSSTGLGSSATLFSSSGTNSVLDLESLSSANAGFNDGGTGQSAHLVQALSGGSVKLPNLTTVTVPSRREDYVQFDVNGGTIDLSSLSMVTGTAGYAYFTAQGGSTLALPSLTASGTSFFQAFSGGTVRLAGEQPIHYSATGLYWANGSHPFYATGSGSLVDAPAVRSFNDAFDDGGSGQSVHYVQALSGGTIKLPNLTTVTVPSRREDYVQFDVNGGTIDLSSLSTVTGTAGYAYFTAQGGSTLALPSLTASGSSVFQAFSGSTVALPSLTASGASFFQAFSGGTVRLTGEQPIHYSATGLYWANGSHSFYATGSGSLVDAPAVRSFNDAFDDGGSGQSVHYVQALSGGTVKLPNLTTVTVPIRREDFVQFDVSSGTLDLPLLSTVTGSAGFALFTAQGGSTLALPSLTASGTSYFQAFSGGTVRLAGAQPIDFSAIGLYWANGSHPFYATGTGSLVDAPAVRSFNDAFDDGGSGQSVHYVQALSGGTVKLPNLTTVTVPIRREDFVQFDVSSGTLDLPLLSTVTGSAGFALFTAQGGSTLALPSLTASGTSYFQAFSGGTVRLAGAQPIDFSATGLYWANGSHPFYATGTGSLVDAPAVRSFNDAFDDGGSGQSVHYVQALSGGAVKLPNLTTVTVPSRREDFVQFDVSGGTMDLPLLSTVTGSAGFALFTAQGGSTLALPSLTASGTSYFQAFSGGTVRLAGAQPIDFSATGLYWANSSHPFYATGTGSLVDAPAVRSFNDAFDDGGSGQSVHYVQALSGGAVKLPNLTTVTVPSRREDFVRFDVSGGTMDLPLLSTVTGSAGFALFTAQGEAPSRSRR